MRVPFLTLRQRTDNDLSDYVCTMAQSVARRRTTPQALRNVQAMLIVWALVLKRR
eukprot:SAG31_NODE_4059_length_3630_cov_2.094308_4_plen_55_part_00